jgi:hypothetical protein
VNGGTVALTATGVSEQGIVAIDPTWTITPTSAGSLAPAVGTSVQFTAAQLGDAVISATYDGVVANSQVAIVSYIPTSSSNFFNIYNDQGLPTNATLPKSRVALSIQELTTGYTPEGTKYQHTTDAVNGDFWGVQLAAPMDATSPTDFSNGSLKFEIRISRALDTGEGFFVKLQSGGGSKTTVLNSAVGFIRSDANEWQTVTMPLSGYFTGGVTATGVDVPFLISTTMNNPISFDIDAVRWTL